MADKDFKTIDEQIEILRSRGLTIEDETEAKDFLLRNNYYRVSGYSLTLRKNDVFAKSAKFQNIEDAGTGANYLRHALRPRFFHYIRISEAGVILWFFDRLRKAPALLAPEPSLSLTLQVQRKF